jgi:hypothetical protein
MPIGLIILLLARSALVTGLALTVEPTPIPYNAADHYGMQVDVVDPLKPAPKWKWKKHWGIN